MCYFPSVTKLIADCIKVVNTAKEMVTAKFPDSSPTVILMGQSFGGLVSTRTVIENPTVVDRLILTSPAIGVKLTCVLKCISPLGGCASSCCPSAPIADAVAPKFLSSDPAECKAYAEDPKVWHDKLRARVANECKISMMRVQDAADSIEMPVLCVCGDGDVVVDIDAAQRLIGDENSNQTCTVRSKDKTYKLFEGLWHTMFHEPRRQEVIDYVGGWVNGHC